LGTTLPEAELALRMERYRIREFQRQFEEQIEYVVKERTKKAVKRKKKPAVQG